MSNLYNCRHSGDQYQITKFDEHMNVESSYLCTEAECNCPAGHRRMCRHREMLPRFIQRGHVNSSWMFDYDRGGWVQMFEDTPALTSEGVPLPEVEHTTPAETEPFDQDTFIAGELGLLEPPSEASITPALVDENDCPGHVSSEHDPKICAHCGVHIDLLRPSDDYNMPLSKDWCIEMAKQEAEAGDLEIGAGLVAMDPAISPPAKSWRRF